MKRYDESIPFPFNDIAQKLRFQIACVYADDRTYHATIAIADHKMLEAAILPFDVVKLRDE